MTRSAVVPSLFWQLPMARRACRAILIGSLLLPACSVTAPGHAEDSLVGIWLTSVPGDYESTREFFDDGTYVVIDAYFGRRVCETGEGTWTEADGVLFSMETMRNGQPVSFSDETPYDLSGNVLTLNYVADEPETWTRAASFPSCADYGWPAFTMIAEVDGVLMDFSANPPTLVLEDEIPDGLLVLEGSFEPNGPDNNCPGCNVLSIEMRNELAIPLAVGSYPMGQISMTGLRGDMTLSLNFPATDVSYRATDGDGVSQPWVGSIEVTSVGPLLIEGTFEATLYDGRATGPPFPSVLVTNGYFRVSYE